MPIENDPDETVQSSSVKDFIPSKCTGRPGLVRSMSTVEMNSGHRLATVLGVAIEHF